MKLDEEDEKIVARSPQPKSLVEFFRESPLMGVQLDLERQKDEARELEL